MQNLRNKKKQTNQKQTHKYSGQFGDGQRGGSVGGLGEWSEGLKKYKLVADGWSWGRGAQHRECN